MAIAIWAIRFATLVFAMASGLSSLAHLTTTGVANFSSGQSSD